MRQALKFLLDEPEKRLAVLRIDQRPPFLDDDVMNALRYAGYIEGRQVDPKKAPIGAIIAAVGHGVCVIIEVTEKGRLFAMGGVN